MDQPLLSVVVPVYNHAPYIEECLRSIAAQETTFPFEVLVGEDCSSDDTRAVLKQLEPTLPKNFTILYRESNFGAVKNGEDLYARARGTYLAELEGDDFYLNVHKLQHQVNFLEQNPDYVATYSNCQVVGADSQPNGEKYPECPYEDYSFKEYFFWCLPGQTGTIVCRRREYLDWRSDFLRMKEYSFYPGDRRNAFLFLTHGKVRCFQEQWSAYRHIVKGGTSHSANVKLDDRFARNEIGFARTLLAYAEQSGNQQAVWAAKQTLFRVRFRWCHGSTRQESLSAILRDIKAEPSRRMALRFVSVRWYFGLLLRVVQGRAII